MKNLFTTALVFTLLFIGNTAFGQNTGDTELTINLGDVYNIKLGQTNVNIDMNTADHFESGSTSGELNEHLTIIATQGYKISVKTINNVFEAPDASLSSLGVNNVELSVPSSGLDEALYQVTENMPLGDVESVLITGNNGGIRDTYNVEYVIPSTNAGNFLNMEAGTYKTEVTYTITAN